MSYAVPVDHVSEPRGRIAAIDFTKGVLVLLMVLYHTLNYLGPVRVLSGGGTSSDGVDAMVTLSSAGDSMQILAYDQYTTLNSSGSDNVTVSVSNLLTQY